MKQTSSVKNPMGFFEWLQLAFIVLKLTGQIDWAWFFVLLPAVVLLGLMLLSSVLKRVAAAFALRKLRKQFEKLSDRLQKEYEEVQKGKNHETKTDGEASNDIQP